ncbi:MAG: hypothetical protein ABIJ56_06890 [Pseudomonadota bacterium]
MINARFCNAAGLCLLPVLLALSAHANDGPVTTMHGGSIKPVKSKDIRLVKEKATFETYYDHEEGFQFFSKVDVHYVLKNKAKETRKVRTGFPFTNCYVTSNDLVKNFHGFSMRDGDGEVEIRKLEDGSESLPTCWVITDLSFGPLEKKELTISYRQQWDAEYNSAQNREEEFFSYILTPAKSWAGSMDSADFKFVMPMARKRPDKKAEAIDLCNMSFSIAPTAMEKKDGSMIFEWQYKNFKPNRELFAYYSVGPCSSETVGVENPVSNFLRSAMLNCETAAQRDAVAAALSDALALSTNKLKNKKYANDKGKKDAWGLPALLAHAFIPTSAYKNLGKQFYKDIKSDRVQDQLRKILVTIPNGG